MDKIIKTDQMFAVFRAIDNELARLNSLHWSCVSFGAAEPTYSNIQKQVILLQEGRAQIGRAFEEQYK